MKELGEAGETLLSRWDLLVGNGVVEKPFHWIYLWTLFLCSCVCVSPETPKCVVLFRPT